MRILMMRMLAAGCLLGLLLTAHAQTGPLPSADAVSSNAPAQDQTAPAQGESPSVTNGQDQTAPAAEASAVETNQDATVGAATAPATDRKSGVEGKRGDL